MILVDHGILIEPSLRDLPALPRGLYVLIGAFLGKLGVAELPLTDFPAYIVAERAAIDALVASGAAFLVDGQLSIKPLGRPLSEHGRRIWSERPECGDDPLARTGPPSDKLEPPPSWLPLSPPTMPSSLGAPAKPRKHDPNGARRAKEWRERNRTQQPNAPERRTRTHRTQTVRTAYADRTQAANAPNASVRLACSQEEKREEEKREEEQDQERARANAPYADRTQSVRGPNAAYAPNANDVRSERTQAANAPNARPLKTIHDDGVFGQTEHAFREGLEVVSGIPVSALDTFEKGELVAAMNAHAKGLRGAPLRDWMRTKAEAFADSQPNPRFRSPKAFRKWLDAGEPDENAPARPPAPGLAYAPIEPLRPVNRSGTEDA